MLMEHPFGKQYQVLDTMKVGIDMVPFSQIYSLGGDSVE